MTPFSSHSFRFSLLLLATACLSLPAGAGTLYKQVDKDGHIVFSDKPQKGMKSVGTIQTQDDAPVSRSALRQEEKTLDQESAQAKRQLNDTVAKRNAAYNRLRQAEDTLAAAKAAKASGQDPLPGERQGTATGGSRLLPAYDERQQSLEKAVDAAQKARDQAQQEWNDVR